MPRILLKGCLCLVGRAARRWLVAAAIGLGVAVAAHGQDETAAPAQQQNGESVRPTPGEPPVVPPAPRFEVEGAIGPVVAISPEYRGGTHFASKFTPGLFLRWGRYTLTNAGGFVTRREDDDVRRGLAADLVRDEHWRANLGLRIDRGREISDDAAFNGLQHVRATVRARLTVTRDLDDSLSVGTSASADLLGRGGGVLVDLSLNKTIPVAPRAWWRLGVALTAADQRYMQSYFGTTPQQAGNPAGVTYSPDAGLRDVSAGISLRGELGQRWIGFVGAGYTILLGPARDSPGAQPTGWGVNGGLAWRFWW